MYKQPFEATEGQTAFEVTDFVLTSDYIVFVGGILINKGYSKKDNSVIFVTGQKEGTEVIIAN